VRFCSPGKTGAQPRLVCAAANQVMIAQNFCKLRTSGTDAS
jgi:hypothetical protein